MKVYVVVPTYNERDNIVSLIEKILAQRDDIHVLVVDDNSPDGTGE
ncbi:glycosyltransferase, partial [bacterium]|nr:glycosyltransferase [bacterium]